MSHAIQNAAHDMEDRETMLTVYNPHRLLLSHTMPACPCLTTRRKRRQTSWPTNTHTRIIHLSLASIACPVTQCGKKNKCPLLVLVLRIKVVHLLHVLCIVPWDPLCCLRDISLYTALSAPMMKCCQLELPPSLLG